MVDVAVACIDRYEAPNQRGVKPLLMKSLTDAEGYCHGQGKRLCSEDEWLRACRGPAGLPYPYGPKYDEHACNQDQKYITPAWGKLTSYPKEPGRSEASRLDQSEPAGNRAQCVSPEGVYDLLGNAGEWVKRTRTDPEACQTEPQKAHRYVVKGCSWVKCYREPHEPACDYVNCAHEVGERSYEFGIRCCRDRQP